MKFNEFWTLKRCVEQRNPQIAKLSLRQFYDQELHARIAEKTQDDYSDVVATEYSWLENDRAFYNVYPAIIKCLGHTSLKVRLENIGAFRTTAICFPVGHEPKLSNGILNAFLFGVFTGYTDVFTKEFHDTFMFMLLMDRTNVDGKRSFSSMVGAEKDMMLLSDLAEDVPSDKKTILSLAVGVSLLSKDPRFTEPILLNRDKDKQFRTDAERDLAVDRARRRGVNGMTIGKDIEVSPHIRRPHFGIRWTGPGAAVPRLVPVNGCLVMKSRLLPIPTGYLGPDDVECPDQDLVSSEHANQSAAN